MGTPRQRGVAVGSWAIAVPSRGVTTQPLPQFPQLLTRVLHPKPLALSMQHPRGTTPCPPSTQRLRDEGQRYLFSG